ncbi:hypothetical protein D3C77_466650 [compost metagenome]
MVHIHTPQVAQAGITLFITNINFADVAGQNAGLLFLGCRAQFFVFKLFVVGQHASQLVFDGGVRGREGEQTRLVHQAAVIVPTWFPQPNASFTFVPSQKALVEHIYGTVGVGGFFLAVLLVEGKE